MAARFAWSGLTVLTDAGKPASAAEINFWTRDTTNDLDTFPSDALSGANANPLICDANGRIPEAWSNDTDVYSIRIRTTGGATVILPTIDDVSFIVPPSVTAANVLAALAANAAAVVINGSQITGSAFAAVADNFDLTAAGSIDASAGAITLGTVTGNTTFSGTVNIGDILAVTDATEASSTTVASAKTAGGWAVVKKTFLGDDVDVAGNVIISTSGKGVGFSATGDAGGATAELLDEYEEGEVAGITIAASTSGTITINTSNDILAYTRIGRLVCVSGELIVTSVSSPVGIPQISSMPFTNINGTETAGIGIGTIEALTLAANVNTTQICRLPEGDAVLTIREGGSTSGGSLFATQIKASTALGINISYHA